MGLALSRPPADWLRSRPYSRRTYARPVPDGGTMADRSSAVTPVLRPVRRRVEALRWPQRENHEHLVAIIALAKAERSGPAPDLVPASPSVRSACCHCRRAAASPPTSRRRWRRAADSAASRATPPRLRRRPPHAPPRRAERESPPHRRRWRHLASTSPAAHAGPARPARGMSTIGASILAVVPARSKSLIRRWRRCVGPWWRVMSVSVAG